MIVHVARNGMVVLKSPFGATLIVLCELLIYSVLSDIYIFFITLVTHIFFHISTSYTIFARFNVRKFLEGYFSHFRSVVDMPFKFIALNIRVYRAVFYLFIFFLRNEKGSFPSLLSVFSLPC